MLNLTNQNSIWVAKTPKPNPRKVYPISMTDKIRAYLGKPHIGTPALGLTVSVDADMAIAQRPFHPYQVEKWIHDSNGQIDWNLFGYSTAVERSDGSKVIIDGQHRISLIKTLDPSIKEVPAHIIKSNDQHYIAKLFGRMNGGASHTVTREERLWADLVAGDQYALDIEQDLINCDFSCGMVNAGNDSTGQPRIDVKLANFEKARKFGITYVLKAAELIRKAYPKHRVIDLQLIGLARFLSAPESRRFLDPKSVFYARFSDWFLNFLPKTKKFQQLKFKKYQNTTYWHNGVAYGIAETYNTWLEGSGFPKFHSPMINKWYKDGLKDKKDSEDDE